MLHSMCQRVVGVGAWLAWVMSCALVVWGCGGCVEPKPPKITPVSVSVTKVTPDGMTLKLVMKLKNPNPFTVYAREVKCHVTLGEAVKLGPVNIKQKLKLPAKKSQQLSVDVKTSWANAGQIVALAATSPKIPYVVEGEVTIGGQDLNVDLPFTIKGEVTREQLLQAGLKGLPDTLPSGLPSRLPPLPSALPPLPF